MSSTATPTGAEPIGTLSSSGSFTGKVRHLKIASNYGTAIFYGDFVKTVAAGTIELDTGTTSLTPTGVFMGCFYTDPTTKQPTYSQFYPASTVASDIKAYVLDDPDVLMKMQGDATLAQTAIGNNVSLVQTAGSTDIGRSKNAIDSSTIAATTATLPMRIVDFVDGPDSSVGDSFTDVIVKFNAGHQYTNTTGI
jgi:hypothetical protein|tara:strand:- start:1098 stop:1679 length:582 start_codon:yes stop_codon:yes gene_type:complete